MVNLKLYAWVTRGKRRTAILKAMYKPMTVTAIRKASIQHNEKIGLNNASDTVRSFVRKKLAVCINPEDRTGRLYQLTEEGEEIRNALLEE